jgi:hypothetical protein
MLRHVGLWLGLLTRCFQSHRSLLLENLALRRQLVVLKRKHHRPRLERLTKIFWVFARHFGCAWKHSLVLVNPETVVCWHRAGFRLYWSLISKARKQVGRKTLSMEVRELIFRMMAENPTLDEIQRGLPFRLLGVDSDNGSEFINWHLKLWCDGKQIQLTRG